MKRFVRIHFFIIVFIISTSSSGIALNDRKIPTPDYLVDKLGWTLEKALNHLGPPRKMFPFRGTGPGEDNIVFYYDNHLYLFWFTDRVWQVRVDERWEEEVGGLKLGMARNDVLLHWGKPLDSQAPEWTYAISDRGYPVQARLYFEDDRLVDLYIYRSDW